AGGRSSMRASSRCRSKPPDQVEPVHHFPGRNLDLFVYLALPMACVIAFWSSRSVHPLLLIVSIVQTLALFVLAWQFLHYAER
ncbi:hypothetical protein ABZ719_12990, partial [Streptomyces sp. NPDC006743]